MQKTIECIARAYLGESQARNRYTFYAKVAADEGFEQIAAIFRETADQEKEHAKRFFNLLKGGECEITASFPAGVIGTVAENLKGAIAGETHEWQDLYPAFAKVAREEGFESVAKAFEAIAVAEKQHAKRYSGLLANVEAGKVFKKDKPVVWRCLNCGYLHEGEEAPKACPACIHPQAYFELLGENW